MTEATTEPQPDQSTEPDPGYGASGRLLSPTAMLRTLNGYEEQAIEDFFGRDQDQLGFGRQLRAMVFVGRLRSGVEQRPAFLEAMSMTVQQVFNEFELLAEIEDDDQDDEADESTAEVEPAVAEPPATSVVRCEDREGCPAPVHRSTCAERTE